ncbi:MAG: NfeD family protein [Pseudomonadota bacterium]
MLAEPWFWMILGALLVLSEFFLTGIIAIFFGIGAVLVGIATALGLISEPPEQIILFAILSLAALLFARDRIKVWFRGNVTDEWSGDKDLITARGQRVSAVNDFRDGVGTVRLSGTDWKAESEDPIAAGETAWVVGHRGITLLVSKQRSQGGD